jgi:hypothetical protein
MTILALGSCLHPRMAVNLDVRRPWSASIWLWAYRSVRCQAPGSNASNTAGYVGALSVTTSIGVRVVAPTVRSKKRWAAVARRRWATNTSMTCPAWSIAPVQVAPLASDLGVGLVDLPAITNRVPAGPGGVCQ